MLGVVVWDLKGEEGDSHEDGKANVCLVEKYLLGLADSMRHRVGSDL